MTLSRFVLRATRAVRLKGEVNVLVTSSQELRKLNRRFRGKNQPTDVLSFPSGLADGLAGDVAISAEIAAKNAQQLGHSTAQEVEILTLHGVLHLAGYDHERDHGEMARKERRLRKSLGLPLGLIERSAHRQRGCAEKNTKAAQKTPRKTGSKLVRKGERATRTSS